MGRGEVKLKGTILKFSKPCYFCEGEIIIEEGTESGKNYRCSLGNYDCPVLESIKFIDNHTSYHL